MSESKIITINLNNLPPISAERLKEMAEDDRPIDYSDIPEITDEDFATGLKAMEELRVKHGAAVNIDSDVFELQEAREMAKVEGSIA